MKQLAIYDSGLGGYSIYHELKTHLPNVSLVLYADQKHAPYGNRTYESLLDVSIKAISSIIEEGITDILVACNTISATSLSTLQLMFPSANIIGIIDITCSQVLKGHTAVLATSATIASKAYEIQLLSKGEVTSIALPDLVQLIEGLSSREEIIDYLNSIPKLQDHYDQVVLGCTHYPLIKDLFESKMNTVILDSKQAILDAIKPVIVDSDNPCLIKTSGNPDTLKTQILELYGVAEEVLQWNL